MRTPMDTTTIADVTMHAADGSTLRLGETWRERPVVLAFVRQFG